MSDLYGLKLEPMPNRLVNYGVTENGIAVIELTSDSAGAPLEGPNDRSPNTYTHGMMRDIDEAVVRARFDDDVTCIVCKIEFEDCPHFVFQKHLPFQQFL